MSRVCLSACPHRSTSCVPIRSNASHTLHLFVVAGRNVESGTKRSGFRVSHSSHDSHRRIPHLCSIRSRFIVCRRRRAAAIVLLRAATLSRRRGMRRQLQTATDSRPETTSSWRWSSRCISRASSHDSARKQDMKPAEYTETRSSSSSKQVSKAHLQPASSQPTNQRRAAPRISRRRRGSRRRAEEPASRQQAARPKPKHAAPRMAFSLRGNCNRARR